MFVLKQTLQEAWGSQAGQKQRELNEYLQVLSSHWLNPNKIVTRMCIMKDGLEYFLVEINGRGWICHPSKHLLEIISYCLVSNCVRGELQKLDFLAKDVSAGLYVPASMNY